MTTEEDLVRVHFSVEINVSTREMAAAKSQILREIVSMSPEEIVSRIQTERIPVVTQEALEELWRGIAHAT